MPASLTTLSKWACEKLHAPSITLHPISRGLSARHYYRLEHDNQPFILADASDDMSEISSFVMIDNWFSAVDIRVPRVYFTEETQGFLLLEDFGAVDLFSELNDSNVMSWYRNGGNIIEHMQKKLTVKSDILPRFDDAFYQREWSIFVEGYLKEYCGLDIQPHQKLLEKIFSMLVSTHREQPQIFVHRDFHSQNLMVLNNKELGVLDFQSARVGPLSYDAVSLLKDCYIEWPTKIVDKLAIEILTPLWSEKKSDEVLLRYFDLTGLQRHLKVMGQFARQVNVGKHSRQEDLTRVERYVLHVLERYSDLHEFNLLLKDIIKK
jgi:aminoglycoside/choline kinase family phosphotransferase